MEGSQKLKNPVWPLLVFTSGDPKATHRREACRSVFTAARKDVVCTYLVHSFSVIKSVFIAARRDVVSTYLVYSFSVIKANEAMSLCHMKEMDTIKDNPFK